MEARKPSADNITEQLRNWTGGKDTEASDAVLNLVYDELHRQAQRYLRREHSGHTLQTTALVHEVYLKFVKQETLSGRVGRIFLLRCQVNAANFN